jgi:predicted branched-subunit amino acid permease
VILSDIKAQARRRGVRDALGVPAVVLAAGMVGFGALALEAGLDLFLAMACTAGIWALPGQLVLVEMHLAGAPGAATVLAVMLTAARFLPMTASLIPVMRGPRTSRAAMYAAAHLIIMTSWALAIRRVRELPAEERLSYFMGFGAALWAVGIAATAAGYYVADAFPPLVRLGLVFLAPLYFVVLLIGEARSTLAAASIVCGAVAGPLMHFVDPQWGVLLAGVGGGTVAYALQRAIGARDV